MAKQSYDLLTVTAPNGKLTSNGLRGFLARQRVDLSEKHSFAYGAASVLAKLSRRRELSLLGIDINTDEAAGQIAIEPTGLLARFMRKEAARLTGNINENRPIAMHNGGFVYTLYQPPVPSSQMVHSFSRVMVQGRRPPRPTTCTLQVTYRCQLDCRHCSAARFTTRDRAELTTEHWLDTIQQAIDLGVYNIVFTGGEPLLRKDVFELVESVDKERAQASMFSNGILLTDETAARLKEAGLYAIMVSLDDVRPEKHDEYRRIDGGFDQACEGIARALDAGLLVGVSTYAFPEDVAEGRVEQMMELGAELGVHEITIFDTVPTGKLLPLEQDQLLTPDDKARIIEIMRDYNERDGYPHVIAQAFVNGPEGAGCFAGFIQFYMTAYGDVNPCDFTPLTFGNIQDDSLENIWNRILGHDAYGERSDHCRMQDPEFRAQYIDDIPEKVLLPWPASDDVREQVHCPHAADGCHSCAE